MLWRGVGISLCGVLWATTAMGGSLPAIKAAGGNKVPVCATSERLMTFVRTRNADVSPRFAAIAADYQRIGEELDIRWDIAFFQMLVETDDLRFDRNGVRAEQNNFAGLGATGEDGAAESFPSVEAGVRAHLQHVLLYAGERVASPVAERTRKVQEWGLLRSWRKSIKGPVSFDDLAARWSSDHDYLAAIEAAASRFSADFCAPSANILTTSTSPAKPFVDARSVSASMVPSDGDRGGGVSVIQSEGSTGMLSVGAQLARQAIERGRAEGDARWSLGRSDGGASLALPFAGAGRAVVTTPPATTSQPTPALGTAAIEAANVAALAPRMPQPAAGAESCRVFTASYGGSRSVIIRQLDGRTANYTVLDVNESDAEREIDAYIDAYARKGVKLGEFGTQPEALDEAFKLCPDG